MTENKDKWVVFNTYIDNWAPVGAKSKITDFVKSHLELLVGFHQEFGLLVVLLFLHLPLFSLSLFNCITHSFLFI